METLVVRRRRPEDVPVVGELVMRQQPMTRYPFRNPLPFPVEQFVSRPTELAAWVAELVDDERLDAGPRLAGHVSVLDMAEHPSGPHWSAVAGRPASEIAAVAVLVVDHELTGRGIARALMDACEEAIRASGRLPMLEVLGAHSRAGELYRRRGWQVVGTDRPAWLPEDEDPVELMVLPG